MIKAVLFDLDGTLLPMDQDVFIRDYFGRLAKKLAGHGYEPEKLIKAVYKGTMVMIGNDGTKTNEEAFWKHFCGIYGEKAMDDMELFEQFYAGEFEEVRHVCGHDERAAQVIGRVKEKGLRAVLATNPLFPPIATHARIRWAGLKKEDLDWITTYDNSSFCKPNPKYFEEVLEKTGLKAEECVMVGNDTSDDLAAAELGMPVFILTDCLINAKEIDLSAHPHGGFDELLAWIDNLH